MWRTRDFALGGPDCLAIDDGESSYDGRLFVSALIPELCAYPHIETAAPHQVHPPFGNASVLRRDIAEGRPEDRLAGDVAAPRVCGQAIDRNFTMKTPLRIMLFAAMSAVAMQAASAAQGGALLIIPKSEPPS